jgi:hypothetical protein
MPAPILPRVQHEVTAVAHQTVGQLLRVDPVHHLRDDIHLSLPVTVVRVDRLAPIATRGDVVNRATQSAELSTA